MSQLCVVLNQNILTLSSVFILLNCPHYWTLICILVLSFGTFRPSTTPKHLKTQMEVTLREASSNAFVFICPQKKKNEFSRHSSSGAVFQGLHAHERLQAF